MSPERSEQLESGSSGTPPGQGILTFLIADVRGYTLFTQERGDEDAAKLAARFAALVREEIEGRGGRVIELRGDEALAVFPSARQAIRAAVQLQDRLVEETLADPSLPLPVGIGIDAGEAVPVEGGYRGGALNLAARLCGRAGPGEILASREAVHLARKMDGIRYRERGPVSMKGLADPVHVVAVLPEGRDPAALLAPYRPARPPSRPRRIMAKLPGPLRSGPRVAITALALVVLAAGIPLVLARSRGPNLVPVPENSVGVLDARTGRIVAQVRVGEQPGGIATGAGSVWVANSGDGTVSRIDPEERRVVQTISVGVDPVWIAVGDSAVWVSNGGEGTVSRINPDTNTVVQTIPVGNGPRGIAVGEGSVWVANGLDNTIAQLDEDTGELTQYILTSGSPAGIAVGLGSVWIANSTEGRMSRIDPSSGDVVASIPVGNGPRGVSIGQGAIWVTNSLDGTVSRVDPILDAVTATMKVAGGPGDVTVTETGVWVTSETGESVVRIDPSSNDEPATVRVGSASAGAAVAADGSVWISTRVSPASHRGGTLRLLSTPDFRPDSLDPAFVQTPYQVQALALSHDGLVAFKRVGGTDGSTLVPDLAISIPAPTDRGRTYTFRLRSGIRYSNGEEVMARDARSSIERLFKAESGSAEIFASILGADHCMEQPGSCDLSEGIVTDDAADTVTFHLSEPDPDFLHKLADWSALVLPSDTPARDVGLEALPATGPYALGVVAEDRFEWVRNPHFHEWSRLAQPDGFPDRIVSEFGGEIEGLLEEALSGQADVVGIRPDRIPRDTLEELQATRTRQVRLFTIPGTFSAVLNTAVRPFNDARVRRALSYAVDRERVEGLFLDPARPTCQLLAPNVLGYRPLCPHTVDPGTDGQWHGPDLEKAIRLVEDSGTKGSRVTIWGLERFAAVNDYMASVLRVLGYRADVREYSGPAAFDLFGDVANSDNRAQLALYSNFIAPSPSSFLERFTCAAFVPHSPVNLNVSQFCDPGLDGLIEEARSLAPGEAGDAGEMWAEIDRRLTEAVPEVSLLTPGGGVVLSERVGNFQFHPVWWILLSQLWVN